MINSFLLRTHLFLGLVLGPIYTSTAIVISVFKKLKSGEEMIFKSLLCVVRRDSAKVFAKLGEPRGVQMRIGLPPL